jgi:hypothetical protein
MDTERLPERPPAKLLGELLLLSVSLRDLYRGARCRSANSVRLRPLLDRHYKDQVRLVDVLIERIRAQGDDDSLMACSLLPRMRVGSTSVGRSSELRMLRDLLEAHEEVLSAIPGGTIEYGSAHPGENAAVHEVALANHRQSVALREQLSRPTQVMTEGDSS